MGLPNNPEILTATFDESSLPGKVTIKLQGFAAR
jgi:hypothetical protein